MIVGHDIPEKEKQSGVGLCLSRRDCSKSLDLMMHLDRTPAYRIITQYFNNCVSRTFATSLERNFEQRSHAFKSY